VRDHLYGLVGILPWRCGTCEKRVRARVEPLHNLLYAHCRICGNLELQRISGEHVAGITSIFGRMFGIQALRCEPCRNKFFALRPVLREERNVAAAGGN
jgi:DNA-directed RNA polymerase subunit RPC12/RpoP